MLVYSLFLVDGDKDFRRIWHLLSEEIKIYRFFPQVMLEAFRLE